MQWDIREIVSKKITKTFIGINCLAKSVTSTIYRRKKVFEICGWIPGLRIEKLNSVSSLLNDQNLREYLSRVTFPVYNVKDFDSLPIPFRAMAADLVAGKKSF